ncbi:hypothetical protein [Yoonia maritima]|uniref:hypothetical protein n=1 Tax=Yoonia maritima TaxID=1435347 RepID=UPI0013A66837|nr:hypothetical protein [Yoonia maritima]
MALFIALAAAGVSTVAKKPALTADLAAYLAAGGSFSDLCGDTTDPSKAAFTHCAACHLIAAVVLPSVCHGPPLVVAGDYDKLIAVAQNIRNAQRLDPARLSRAPPHA